MHQTCTMATMAVPTIEGMTNAVEALKASCEAGKWTLLAPDGRVWMNQDPMILFAALAAVMQGVPLGFGELDMIAKGERPRIVVGCDIGRADRTVHVLLRYLADGGIEVLDVKETPVHEIIKALPVVTTENIHIKPARVTHGPVRKGKGGKDKRW